MIPLAHDIRSARAAVERLLDEIGLRAYTYTVEPKENGWTVRIECATADGFQQATFAIDPQALGASASDPTVRAKLREAWELRLKACATPLASPVARWEHYEHSADIGVRGIGATKAEAFEQAALALTAVATDPRRVEPREWVAIECEAPDDELLFAEWLNALVLEMATRNMLFGRFLVRIDGPRLAGSAWGEKIDVARHHPAAEVKGATYTTLRVAKENGVWLAQTVVDV
jgi:tRNA nucleotidyltransferase (CCA-adding enzyme)